MTKKETIIKSWIDLGVKTPFGICDNTGFYHGYFCNGVDEILEGFDLKIEQIDYDLDFDGVGKFRPKSLQGIEYNNGWVKIGEDNLIHFEGDLWGLTKNKEIFFFSTDEFIEKGLLTHYQPIIKPDLPLY